MYFATIMKNSELVEVVDYWNRSQIFIRIKRSFEFFNTDKLDIKVLYLDRVNQIYLDRVNQIYYSYRTVVRRSYIIW